MNEKAFLIRIEEEPTHRESTDSIWLKHAKNDQNGHVRFTHQKGMMIWMKMQQRIDLHCHILPGMDDGSPDVDTSLSMLRQQAEQGTTIVCASSHYYADQNSIADFCERRARALKKLQAVMPKEGLPRIILAAEVAYFPGIEEEDCLEKLCIEGTRTILLEMPMTEWNKVEIEAVSVLVLDRGFRVVLVHPERFCFSQRNRERLKELEKLPVAFQVNADTLLHFCTRKLGLKLLQKTTYPLLGSDCHNTIVRPPNLAAGRKVVSQKLGEEFLVGMDLTADWLIQSKDQKMTPEVDAKERLARNQVGADRRMSGDTKIHMARPIWFV